MLIARRIAALHEALVAAGLPIRSVGSPDPVTDPPTVNIRWLSAPTAGESATASAIVSGWVWTEAANQSLVAKKAKQEATSGIDNGTAVVGDKTERLVRALMEIVLDEFNLHALKHNAILDATDAATSLADFKARVALIPDYPARTAAQLVNAIKTKISASAE